MTARLWLVTAFSAWFAACSAGTVSGPQDGGDFEDGVSTTDDFIDGRDAAPDDLAPDAFDGTDAGADPGMPECGRVSTFEEGKTPGRFLHVSPTGSDQNGDGTFAHPFASMERAARDATSGTSVVVHSGTYAGGGWLENIRGTADAPIWIGGAAGEQRPVIEGGSEALHLVRPRYLVVHDLEVRGTADNGINCDDGGDYADDEAARFVVFRGLDIHDVGGDGNQDCLKLSGLNDYWVLDGRFARCGGGMSGSGIDHVGCHRGLIAGCRFEQNSGNAVQCKGGSYDIDVVRNVMEEPGERAVNMGGSTGFEYFRPPLSAGSPNAEARRIRVQANLIIGGTAALAFVGCVDCLAAHNTVVNPSRWLLRILQETITEGEYAFEPCRQNAVVNNIFYFDRSVISTHVNIGPDTAPESFSFAGNLWYAHDDPSGSEPQLPAAESDGLYGQDPGFENAAGRDFYFPATSPAAGSGASWPDLADADLDGRCYGSPPSRGAYEAR